MAHSAEEDTPHDIAHNYTSIVLPRMLQEAGLIMASGSAWAVWGSRNVIDNRSLHDKVKTAALFVRDRSGALGKSLSRNPIAFMTSETSWERQHIDGKNGYWNKDAVLNGSRALQDARFGVDIINENILNLKRGFYRAVVISDGQRELLPRTVESLKAFVEAGGTLLVMGSGLLDCPGKESDIGSLLGLERAGTAGGNNSLNMGGKTASFGSVWNVKNGSARVLAAYGNGKPFLTRHAVGKGAVAYVSAAETVPYPDNNGVFAWIMERLDVNPKVRVKSGDQGKHLVYSFRSKPGRLFLHVVNITSHVKGKRIEPNASNDIDPVAVIPRLELDLELLARPQKVTVLPAKSGVTHTWDNGTLNLTLTNVDYHAAVEMTLDGQYKAQYGKEKE
jgi:hypothetical protein